MTEAIPERRRHPRAPVTGTVQVMVDDKCYPAELADLSPRGMQARLDPLVFDEIRESIDAVRFDSLPPLAVKLQWGFFDGNFGASFKDDLEAGHVIEHFIAAHGNPVGAGAK